MGERRFFASAAVFGICFLFCSLFSHPSYADFQKGLAAYETGDYRTAALEWSENAHAGDVYAQRNLGHLYRWGKGVPKDMIMAKHYYELASEQGFARAQFNLALLYLNGGEGVPKDEDKALFWFQEAAKRGDRHSHAFIVEITKVRREKAKKTVLTFKEKTKTPKPKQVPSAVREPVSLAHLASYTKAEDVERGWKRLIKLEPILKRFKQRAEYGFVAGPDVYFRLYAEGSKGDVLELCRIMQAKTLYCQVVK